MDKDAENLAAFWKHLRSDRTVMLGVEANSPTSLRPMTAQTDSDRDEGPIWFFTSVDTTLVSELQSEDLALMTFTSKGHDLFANVHGHLSRSHDRAVIDRLWNPFVAAWYEDGKDDPKLCLLRFDPVRAEIWLDGSSLMAGLKLLFGADPKVDYQDKVSKVSLA